MPKELSESSRDSKSSTAAGMNHGLKCLMKHFVMRSSLNFSTGMTKLSHRRSFRLHRFVRLAAGGQTTGYSHCRFRFRPITTGFDITVASVY